MSTYKKIKHYYLVFAIHCYQFMSQKTAVTSVEYAIVAAAVTAVTIILTDEGGAIRQLFVGVFGTSSNKIVGLVAGHLAE